MANASERSLKNIVLSWTVRVGLLIASVIVSLGIAEVGVRLFFGPMPHQQLRGFVVADQELGFRMRENFPRRSPFLHIPIWSNDLGCFDNAYHQEKPYILLLGDGFTWGVNSFNENLGTLLEKDLGVRVIKAGMFCYGTRQELLWAQRVIQKIGHSPKLIVVGYSVLNDMLDDYLAPGKTVIDGSLVQQVVFNYEDGVRVYYPPEDLRRMMHWAQGKFFTRNSHTFKYWVSHHSRLYSIMRNKKLVRWLAIRLHVAQPLPEMPAEYVFIPSTKDPYFEAMWDNHKESIKRFQGLAMSQNSELMFAFIPYKVQVYKFMQYANFKPAEMNALVGSFMQESGIKYLDLLPTFEVEAPQEFHKLDKKYDLYQQDTMYWNPEGEKLAAKKIATYIRARNLLGTTPDGQ